MSADVPAKGLLRGQVGTVVETLAPGVLEVEFSDDQGAPTRNWRSKCAQLALKETKLLLLPYQPITSLSKPLDRDAAGNH